VLTPELELSLAPHTICGVGIQPLAKGNGIEMRKGEDRLSPRVHNPSVDQLVRSGFRYSRNARHQVHVCANVRSQRLHKFATDRAITENNLLTLPSSSAVPGSVTIEKSADKVRQEPLWHCGPSKVGALIGIQSINVLQHGDELYATNVDAPASWPLRDLSANTEDVLNLYENIEVSILASKANLPSSFGDTAVPVYETNEPSAFGCKPSPPEMILAEPDTHGFFFSAHDASHSKPIGHRRPREIERRRNPSDSQSGSIKFEGQCSSPIIYAFPFFCVRYALHVTDRSIERAEV